MLTWRAITLTLELKGFENGLNDARRRTVDSITYQINQEYRSGVDIAQQLKARLNVALNEMLNRPMEQINMAGSVIDGKAQCGAQ